MPWQMQLFIIHGNEVSFAILVMIMILLLLFLLLISLGNDNVIRVLSHGAGRRAAGFDEQLLHGQWVHHHSVGSSSSLPLFELDHSPVNPTTTAIGLVLFLLQLLPSYLHH
jgi:hypothetical protein